jgi:glycosyltransferase involved in cell wall biosynthesis
VFGGIGARPVALEGLYWLIAPIFHPVRISAALHGNSVAVPGHFNKGYSELNGAGQDSRVTACIPYFRCKRYVRRAVESLLRQTHRDINVIVVNDGDPQQPWDQLAHIKDPRLICHSLEANHGPYFITAIVLNAISTPYFLIQDADDWSAPHRVEHLLRALQEDGSDLAVSAEPQFIEDRDGVRVVDVRWHSTTRERSVYDYMIDHRITSAYKYRAPHHGLFRVSSLRSIGGYYGGLRISYDTLLTNLVLMIGRISHVPEYLYYRLLRDSSLTHDVTTGTGSANAKRASAIIRQLYDSCFLQYQLFLEGRLSRSRLAASIKQICGANITASDRHALALETERILRVLGQPRSVTANSFRQCS